MVAESAKHRLLGKSSAFPSGYEDERLAYCPNCGNDTFRIYDRKTFVCSVCGKAQKTAGGGIRPADSLDKISPAGSKEHSAMIGGKIENGFAASEDIARRLDVYLSTGSFDNNEYRPMSDSDKATKVEWTPDGLEEFSRVVPRAFQSFVKKAVEKKAVERGAEMITKELFLEIKKASGN